jgi:hypothetical protein
MKIKMKLNLNRMADILTILVFGIFVGLKLFNVIKWSWWWVMSPLWIPILLFIIVCIIWIIFHIASTA